MSTAVNQDGRFVRDYSQCGESKIVYGLLSKFPTLDRTCVEVGAADGKALSNTRTFSEHFGFRRTLIELDAMLFEKLERTAEDGARCIHAAAGWGADDGLDALGLPVDADFMSIDIDGNDYHVWDAMQVCRPKVVCIEFNPTMGNDVSFVQAKDSSVQHGSSIRSIVNLGASKGYHLAAVTTFNAIFVRDDLFPLVRVADNSLSALRPNPPLVTHLFTGYDGTVFVDGHRMIPWHDVRIDAHQVIPKVFRQYARGKWRDRAFKAWRKLWQG